jgi:hypothetical protein
MASASPRVTLDLHDHVGTRESYARKDPTLCPLIVVEVGIFHPDLSRLAHHATGEAGSGTARVVDLDAVRLSQLKEVRRTVGDDLLARPGEVHPEALR